MVSLKLESLASRREKKGKARRLWDGELGEKILKQDTQPDICAVRVSLLGTTRTGVAYRVCE